MRWQGYKGKLFGFNIGGPTDELHPFTKSSESNDSIALLSISLKGKIGFLKTVCTALNLKLNSFLNVTASPVVRLAHWQAICSGNAFYDEA